MKQKNENLNELKEQNKLLRELLMQSIVGLCSYRAIKGKCAQCKDAPYCTAKKLIPKIEKTLNIRNDGTIFKL